MTGGGSTPAVRRRLRDALTALLDGTDRSEAAIERATDDVSMTPELRWAAIDHLKGETELDAVVALAEPG